MEERTAEMIQPVLLAPVAEVRTAPSRINAVVNTMEAFIRATIQFVIQTHARSVRNVVAQPSQVFWEHTHTELNQYTTS